MTNNDLLIPDFTKVNTEADFIKEFNRVREQHKDEFVEFKTVPASEVGMHTLGGMIGVPLYFYQDSFMFPPVTEWNHNTHRNEVTAQGGIGTKTYVMVGFKFHEKYDQALKTIWGQQQKINELELKVSENGEVLKTVHSDLSRVKNDLEYQKTDSKRYNDQYIAEREKSKKLEGDITKLTKALGELRMLEILEGK